MNKNNLLDNCLSILYTIKEDKESLEKLLKFMEEKFVQEAPIAKFLPDCKLQIDEKYRLVVKKIAEYLEMGHWLEKYVIDNYLTKIENLCQK